MSVPGRLAIVGCGLITHESHLPAALKSRAIEVTALVDSDVTHARILARKYGCAARTTADLEQGLNAADAMLVATPNQAPAEVARRALERGLSVLVEKPLTTTSREAGELVDPARRKSAILSVGFMTRHFLRLALLLRV